jgi:hypothetical protein
MITEFDDKGKIFTNVISKKPIEVIIQAADYRIQGNLYVTPGERIKDELNSSDGFIALTDTVVCDQIGKELYATKFLTLNASSIIWLIPVNELIDNSDHGGSE